MFVALQKVLMLVGVITILVLWKSWFPGSWASFWNAIFGMII